MREFAWKHREYRERDLFEDNTMYYSCGHRIGKPSSTQRKGTSPYNTIGFNYMDNFLHSMTGKMAAAGRLGLTKFDEDKQFKDYALRT